VLSHLDGLGPLRCVDTDSASQSLRGVSTAVLRTSTNALRCLSPSQSRHTGEKCRRAERVPRAAKAASPFERSESFEACSAESSSAASPLEARSAKSFERSESLEVGSTESFERSESFEVRSGVLRAQRVLNGSAIIHQWP
jgi:hypothetical protein